MSLSGKLTTSNPAFRYNPGLFRAGGCVNPAASQDIGTAKCSHWGYFKVAVDSQSIPTKL